MHRTFIDYSYFWYMNFSTISCTEQFSCKFHQTFMEKWHPWNIHEIIFIGASVWNFDHFMEIAIHFMDKNLVVLVCILFHFLSLFSFSNCKFFISFLVYLVFHAHLWAVCGKLIVASDLSAIYKSATIDCVSSCRYWRRTPDR